MGTTSPNRTAARTFGPFVFHPDCGELARNGSRIRLQPQPALVLVLLTDQPGKLISREEIYRAVWGEDTHVDFEQSLNYCIRQIRSTLRDDADNPTYLETVPKRGYRFLCPVTLSGEVGSRSDTPESAGAIAALAPAATPEAALSQKSFHTKVWALAFGVVVLLAASAIVWRTYRVKSASLHASDTVVLADFANGTGDPIFDDTLKTALNVSLRQSPFLNVLPESEIAKTLQLMTRPPETKLTPEIAREICQREGSKAYIAGSIGSLGSEYVLGLRAVNCESGDTLAQEQVTAGSKEKSARPAWRGRSQTAWRTWRIAFDGAEIRRATGARNYFFARSAESVHLAAMFYEKVAACVPALLSTGDGDSIPNFAMGYRAIAGTYLTLLHRSAPSPISPRHSSCGIMRANPKG